MVEATFIHNKGHHSQNNDLIQNTKRRDAPQDSEDQDTAHTSDGAAWTVGHSSHTSLFLFLCPEKIQKEISHVFIFYLQNPN